MEENQDSNINNTRENSLLKEDTTKQPLIAFAKINKYFLIPFLCPVFCMLANYFIIFINEAKVIKKEEFALSFFILLSYVGAGLLYFISYFRQKVDGGKEEIIYRERPSTSIKYIYNEGVKKSFLKECILIILLGFLITLFELLSMFSHGKKLFQERLYFLFFIPLFSKFILSDNIFRHQYFSLLIAIFGIILLIIPTCLVIGTDDILANILKFTASVGYSLFLTLIKYVTHTFYISPFKLSLIFGLISLGFIFFGFLIYSLVEYHDLSYFKNCVDFSGVDNKFLISLYFILTFIFATALQFFTLLVIFYFSPILLMVTDIISPMLLWIVLTIQKGTKMPDGILLPVGYLIVLFASLIYNEIIIFNFWGLSKDTKKFVEERLKEESSDLRKTENDLKLGSFERSEEGSNGGSNDEEERFSHSS